MNGRSEWFGRFSSGLARSVLSTSSPFSFVQLPYLNEDERKERVVERGAPMGDQRREGARIVARAADVRLSVVEQHAAEGHRPEGERRDHRIVQHAADARVRYALSQTLERLPHLQSVTIRRKLKANYVLIN